MQKKYTISLILILFFIVGLLYIHSNYRMFQNKKNNSVVLTLMSDDLSVNFLNGNPITVQEEERNVEFSVTNFSSKKLFYSISFNTLFGDSEQVTYQIVKENGDKFENSFDNNVALNRHEILPGVTERYEVNIKNDLNKEFSFEIKVDVESMNHEFQNVILSGEVKDGSEINFADHYESGLYKRIEQQGDIYFYRGNVSNNYFSFADHLWRIVKINEDGTVKLVLNDTTKSMVPMYESEESFNDFFDSSVYSSLEEWYKTNLTQLDEYIASTKYCFDNGVLKEEESNLTYLASVRLFTDYLPSNVCNGTSITSKVALLTADDLMLSGATTKENKDYYLYDSELQSGWWTMTPTEKENNKTYFITLNKDGSLEKETAGNLKLFLKPVITLNRKVKVVGEGTLENPYKIET